MSLEPVDDIYKNKFESYQAPYNEAAWLQMQNTLQPTGRWAVIKSHVFNWYTIVPTASLAGAALVYLVIGLHLNNNNSAVKPSTASEAIHHKSIPQNDILNKSTIRSTENASTSNTYASASIKRDLKSISLQENTFHSKADVSNNFSRNQDLNFFNPATKSTMDGTENNRDKHHVTSITYLTAPASNKGHQSTNQKELQNLSDIPAINTSPLENGLQSNSVVMENITHIPFSLLGLGPYDDRSTYLPFAAPKGVKQYMVTLTGGINMIDAKNGFKANNGKESSLKLSRINKHFVYSIGLGLFAFDQSKSTLTDSSFITVLKTPFVYYQRTLDTVIPIYYHHKIINDSIWHYVKTTTTKDSVVNNKASISKQIASNLRFIEVPVSMSYRINAHRWHFDAEAGASFLINQSKSFKYYLPEGGYSTIKPYNGFSLNGGIHIGYRFNSYMGAMIYGKYCYGSTFDALPNGDKIMWNAYSTGLGLYYRF